MKKSIYNRIMILITIIMITIIILLNFIMSKNKYVITPETICCILIISLLVLAESFDNLSIPKLISLSRNIKSVEKENDKLHAANLKLLEQFVNIKNTNNQITYMPGSINTIGSSNIEDLNKNNINNNEIDTINNNLNDNRNYRNEGRKYRSVLEIFLLKKILKKFKSNDEIQYDVKIINNSIEDNIMKSDIRFDALQTNGITSTFYEVKSSPFFSIIFMNYIINCV